MATVSVDEGANDGFALDFSQLLDLPDATTAAGDSMEPLLAEPDDFLERDPSNLWDLAEPIVDPYHAGLEEPDYGKFENWIPRYIRPEKPCDYCRLKRLVCYKTREEDACTPCLSLFRDCSLTNTHAFSGANPHHGFLLDTLHVVEEDAAKEWGTVTGIKPMKSKARANGTHTPVRLDDAPGSSKRNGIRFPRHAVKTLRDWLDAHGDNPYPTEEEKAELEKKTELKPSQIANWLANARRRRKVTEKSQPRLCASPSLRASTPAIPIPPAADKPWDELDPFERWQHSPPENEPASITDIANAVAHSDLLEDDQVSTSPSTLGRRQKRSSNGSGFSNVRAASSDSLGTGQTSSASTSAAYSHHSSQSHGSFGSFSSGLAGKRDRRRRRRPTTAQATKPSDDKKRIFQCTFCTDTFKSKYDWTRHEKSLHLSLEKWICAPLGPVITDPATGTKKCVYCDALNPSDDHIEAHNYKQCEDKGFDARTFYRKDHLRQHMRLMHNCEMTPFMENWKSVAVHINSRCGFCAKRYTIWQERVDHLTAHFKAGARMVEWKGCRGLDPAVAAQVTNAMPPYLIGMESVSPIPFSASNKATWEYIPPSEAGTDEHIYRSEGYKKDVTQTSHALEPFDPNSYSSVATCWEILTVRLGKYANEMSKKGIVLTDEMLQSKARHILYESDDTWNQTAADNPEWLDLFKKAHGLDFIPTQIGGEGEQIPQDLETYGDLGLRIPFAVQLKAYNEKLDEEVCKCDRISGQHTISMHAVQDPAQTSALYTYLANEGVWHFANGRCSHTECEDNVLGIDGLNDDNTSQTMYRWCTYDLPPEKAKKVAIVKNTGTGYPSLSANGDMRYDSRLGKHYFSRHRYQLPKDRARQYATTTGAWDDSGKMPVATTFDNYDKTTATTTGAMMEFLGGQVGGSLPFSSDEMTSMIPLQPEVDWTIPLESTQEEAMNFDIDQLIAETTEAQTQQNMVAETFPLPSNEFGLSNDLAMEDLNFDDLVFDMTMDDTFDQSTGV